LHFYLVNICFLNIISKYFLFLASVLEDGGNKEWVEMDKRWLEEQKQEFHEMDEDNDGVLTKDELLKAYDPMNRVHINNQIKKLFLKVDDSPSDNVLTLNEIQKHADIFTDMRILDTEKALHDEM
jgi:Ca2+-binding EF-hand superfamily protein